MMGVINKMKFQIHKMTLFFLCLFFVLCWVYNLCPLQIQGKQQEKVAVIAVEVPVRVLQKGQYVKGLTREDFELFENGIKQQITGFEVHSRRISVPIDVSEEELKIEPEKRLFLLIFNIFDYQDYVGEAIDYFFANTFRQGDRIIILTEGNLIDIDTRKRPAGVAQDIKDTLKKFKVISTGGTYSAYQDLRTEADSLILTLIEGPYEAQTWDQAVRAFYRNYERTWIEYKRQFIMPDLELYQSIIKRIKAIEGEKWALCFQQREMFPKLKNEGRLDRLIRERLDEPSDSALITLLQRNIKSTQMRLQRLFLVSGDMPTEAMKNLFLEANITFHLLLIKSYRSLVEQDFELREVGQDYEDCLRQISFSTGGHTVFSNKVVDALEEASQTEDYYYLLVYSPKAEQTEEQMDIDVKVNRKGAHVIHLKKFAKKSIFPISISNFKSDRKTISFSMENYQRVKMEGKLAGVAQVRISLFDENSTKVYDQTNTLSLIKEETHISIPFQQLKSGNYFIIIQVIDRITNHIDVFSRQIRL
jgi:hypothetical protein